MVLAGGVQHVLGLHALLGGVEGELVEELLVELDGDLVAGIDGLAEFGYLPFESADALLPQPFWIRALHLVHLTLEEAAHATACRSRTRHLDPLVFRRLLTKELGQTLEINLFLVSCFERVLMKGGG